MTHIFQYGKNSGFATHQPIWQIFTRKCVRKVGIILLKFEPHLNKWNSHPGDSFSWYWIFEVTPLKMAIFEMSNIQIIERISHLWVKFRNFWILTKTSDPQLYSLQIWTSSDTNSRNASHLLSVDSFFLSRIPLIAFLSLMTKHKSTQNFSANWFENKRSSQIQHYFI